MFRNVKRITSNAHVNSDRSASHRPRLNAVFDNFDSRPWLLNDRRPSIWGRRPALGRCNTVLSMLAVPSCQRDVIRFAADRLCSEGRVRYVCCFAYLCLEPSAGRLLAAQHLRMLLSLLSTDFFVIQSRNDQTS